MKFVIIWLIVFGVLCNDVMLGNYVYGLCWLCLYSCLVIDRDIIWLIKGIWVSVFIFLIVF